MFRLGTISSIAQWRWPWFLTPATTAPAKPKKTGGLVFWDRTDSAVVPTHDVSNAPNHPNVEDFSVPARGPKAPYG